jgi:hypothetical protein
MSDIAAARPDVPRRVIRGLAVALVASLFALAAPFAFPQVIGVLRYEPMLESLFAELHRDPVLVEALREQNSALADKDDGWALAQDRIWNGERLEGGGPLQRAYMDRPASRHLRDVLLASEGLVGHALLIDAKGRVAAEPYLSFNFRQFDKPKFQDTFPLGAGARHVSWLQLSFDGSHPVCWQAETMVDPKIGAPIGVLALEVNYLEVGYFGCIERPLHSAGERATNRTEAGNEALARP